MFLWGDVSLLSSFLFLTFLRFFESFFFHYARTLLNASIFLCVDVVPLLYRSVVLMSLWPIISRTTLESVVLSSFVTKPILKECVLRFKLYFSPKGFSFLL